MKLHQAFGNAIAIDASSRIHDSCGTDSMSVRIPSARSQQDLARALLRIEATRKDVARLLRDVGREDLAYKLPKADDDEAEMRDGVRLLAQRGVLDTDFFNKLEEAYGELHEELERLRVDMELEPPPSPVVDDETLKAIKLAAREGGLHRGVQQSRLKTRLPAEFRAAAATAMEEPDQLDAWLDAARRQRLEPGDEFWMLRFLESAVEEASEPGQSRLRDHLNDLRLRLPGDPRRIELSDEDRGSLQRMVQRYGIMLNAADFLAAVSAGLARCCLVRIAGRDTGTAFLVGDDLVLTNSHVLFPGVDNAGPGQVEFRFDYRSECEPGIVTTLKMTAPNVPGDRSWLIDTSPPTGVELQNKLEPIDSPGSPDHLDFALVRIADPIGAGPASGLPRRGYFDIAPKGPAYPLAAGTALMIFGHPIDRNKRNVPVARPQVFSIAPDAVVGTNPNGTRVRYLVNTDAGSSGSPVLTTDGRVVALHHAGTEKFNQGIPLAAIVARPKVAAAVGGGG